MVSKTRVSKGWFQKLVSKCDFQGLISGGIVFPVALSVIAYDVSRFRKG